MRTCAAARGQEEFRLAALCSVDSCLRLTREARLCLAPVYAWTESGSMRGLSLDSCVDWVWVAASSDQERSVRATALEGGLLDCREIEFPWSYDEDGNVIIMATYFKIFRLVRQHQKQIQIQQHWIYSCGRQRKHAVTMGFVIGAMMCCYFPLCCLYAIVLSRGIYHDIAIPALFCMVSGLSSSLWNPMIYCWRNRDIKVAVIHQLKQFKGLLFGLKVM